MANTKLLYDAVDGSGLKIGYIAECLGISRPTLNTRLKDPDSFTGAQIGKLCQLLRIDDEMRNKIFFA